MGKDRLFIDMNLFIDNIYITNLFCIQIILTESHDKLMSGEEI